MSNDPTRLERYFGALRLEQDSFDDALGAIRAELAAGRIAKAEAAAERAGLLEAHLRRLAALRAEHLGEQPRGELPES